MKTPFAIQLKNFYFQYQEVQALNNLSFSIEKGDFVSVIGPNGSGKTTLLKCLTKILPYGMGDLLILGKPLLDYSQKSLAQKISYVPQNTFTQSVFSVFELVLMGRYPHLNSFSVLKKEDKELCFKALHQTGSFPFRNRFLNTLSGGERQKVFISSALAQGAKILLLDEPTLFLDPKSQFEIYNLLRELNQTEKLTILLVTHDINSAVQYGKKILALKEGHISYFGESKSFMTRENLETLFSTSFHFIEDPKTKVKFAFKA